ncbi:MAG: hypothetical protein J0M12_12280 [Deltaproteobacteria bacterium]|nr:hypothetical protein [Deltaproteobacteria bacterium]
MKERSDHSQLSLNITPRHAYAPENFVLHDGVREILAQQTMLARNGDFRIAYVTGLPRSGKTHLSIRLADELARQGCFPRVLEGREFAEFLESSRFDFTREDALLVDDAQNYFAALKPGQSGPFVACIERLRLARAGIVFFSDRDISAFEFDEHVRSRVIPGLGLAIGAPSEGDMTEIIRAVAKQHGMRLSEKKLGFILKRVGRNIGSVEDYFQRLIHLSQVLGRPIKFPLMSGVV